MLAKAIKLILDVSAVCAMDVVCIYLFSSFQRACDKHCIKLCQGLFAKNKHAAVSKLSLQAPRIKSLPKNKAKFLVTFQWLLDLRLSDRN